MSDNRQYRKGKGAAGRKVKRFVISGMSVVVVTSSMNLGMVSSAYAMEPQNVSEGEEKTDSLVISEVVADTTAPADRLETGADAFEYVEIYNPTDQTQSLDNYQIRDITQDAAAEWKIPEGTTVDAGKTLIIWINNKESQSLKAEDFCSYYGISQDEVQIVKTRDLMEGLDGDEARALQITDSEGEEIFTQALYNEEEEKAQADKGISFLFEEGMVQETVFSYEEDPTPGILGEDQVKALQEQKAENQQENGEDQTPQEETAENTLPQTQEEEQQPAVQSAENRQDEGAASTRQNPQESRMSTPLVISEIVPNTDNVGGSDAYEYFEIYNVGDQPADLSQYKFMYDNGNSVKEWKLTDSSIQLNPQETLTVWVKNTANTEAGYTAENFNSYYSTDLEEGKNLTTVESDGFSNSGSRKLIIQSETGLVMSEVTYTAGDSSDGSLGVDEAVVFDYDGSDVTPRYDNDVTPGRLDDSQTIRGQYAFPEPVAEPAVAADAPAVVKEGEDWTVIMADTNLSADILSASLNVYKEGTAEAAASVPMIYQDGVLKAAIPYNQLQDLESFSYNIVVSDGVNTAVSGMQTASVEGLSSPVDRSKAPALVVSEILPDSSNVNGADAYEFIEIYNNSNRDIDLKDYKLYYNYPDNGDNSDVVWWETSESRILKSGDTLVFWIKNGGNDGLTVDDFNAKFGTSLDSSHLIEISCGGMANSGARGVKIATNVKDNVDYVTYNMNGADNTNADKSILFRSQYADGAFASVLTADDAVPTPGAVSENAKPDYQAELPASVSSPVLTDRTPASFNSDNDLTFALDAVSAETTVKTVHLYVRDNNSDDYEMYNLLRENGDSFSKSLSAIDLYGKQYYEYYFEVSDGYQTVSTEVKRIENENPLPEGDQLNVSDNEFLSGTRAIIGTGGNLLVDGQDVSSQTVPSINGDAQIVFDTSQTDVFFKNAVAVGNDVLGIFNEGTYDTWATYAYDVDESYFDSETKQITIAFHAGNKANALEHDIENNDDFVLKNIRLALPDGVSLRPVSYEGVYGIGAIEHTADNWHPENPAALGNITPETEISMGDGTSKVEILYVTFQLQEENFNAVRYDLDTTTLADGPHTIVSGERSASVIVDNTAPEITTNIEDGAVYREQEIQASATDALSENTDLTARLDDQAIGLPYTISSKEMEPGEHTLVLTATDEAGNTSEKAVTFEIPEENASAENTSPEDGSTVHGNPTLSVNVTDPTNDQMTVTFKKGEKYKLGDSRIAQSSGISSTMGSADQSFAENTGNGFPYQIFDIQAGENTGAEDEIRVQWEGSSNNVKTFMYVYNTVSGGWDKVDAQQTTDGENMTLTGDIALQDHLAGTAVRVMIQNGEGYTPAQYAPGAGDASLANEKDTPRDNYDFTFVVESDTQYYNEDFEGNPDKDVDGQYQYQLDIHNWILANRERMNIQYLFHDGDLIDDEPLIPEWENADRAYAMLDQAGLPYGVLAGNHDVGHLSGDYTNYYKYFGESRYNQNPWYGGSYKNNRGHYDLITVDGIDFIMLYMGWGVGDEEIDWMNQVLARYPERKAILNFHEYLLASGGLGEEPQRVYDEVVAKNPNVCMVLSGHYHNAQTRVDSFDDDGDGIAERNVYQMLFDYQGLAGGGMGYIRLMHFDTEGQKIIVRTYSPTLNDYDAKDQTGIGDVAGINGEEEFEISFDDLGITPQVKSLETSGLSVDVYGDEIIGTVENVESGTEARYIWNDAPEGTTGWYAEITDENGGITRTDVNYLTVEKTGYEPVITLPGASSDTVSEGSSFDALAGVSAEDCAGNDITDRIIVEGTVDTSVSGAYELIYRVTDENGNTAEVTRTVLVTEKETENPGQTPGENPGGNQGQTPGRDPGQTPDDNPDQMPGGNSGTQGTVPGGDNGAGTGSQNQGFQNMSFDKNGGGTVSGLKANVPETSDAGIADLGMSLLGLLASVSVIAALVKKKITELMKKQQK